jgi:hypothetical protein
MLISSATNEAAKINTAKNGPRLEPGSKKTGAEDWGGDDLQRCCVEHNAGRLPNPVARRNPIRSSCPVFAI